MIFNEKTFTKEDIHLDFNEFNNCKFIECNIIYHGYGHVGMEDCSFEKIRMSFSNAAANTINFMSAIYNTGPGENKKFIDDVIKNIITGNMQKFERYDF